MRGARFLGAGWAAAGTAAWAAACVVAGLGAATPARAGGENSAGGADDFRIVPAFFRAYGDRAVTGCYEVAEGFGVAPETLGKLVRDAFGQWGGYLREKRLDLVPSSLVIQSRLELRQGCDGTENLRVLFGVVDGQVSEHLAQFQKPFGFASLLQADDDGQAPFNPRGLVWIAPPGFIDPTRRIPDWTTGNARPLAGLVLHEVGHVFGNGHVDGTAMTEWIGKYLEEDTAPGQAPRNLPFYSRIDAQIELVPCMECHTAYAAAETFDPIVLPGQPKQSDWFHTFRRLVGREPVEPLMIRYERMGSPEGAGQLTVMDALETHSFEVRVESLWGERKDSTMLFVGQGGTEFYSFGRTYLGRIQPLTEPAFPVGILYNMDGRKVQILPGGAHYPRPIFVSAP
jgi:hypothetical protein